MNIALPQSATPRVSIIIACSVRTDLLAGCLRSIARHVPPDIPFETIVVLNGVGADDAAKLRAEISGVDIVRSTVNLGFAGAGNLGRSRARGQDLILLHDDAEILPGWMEALTQTVDRHPEAGAVGAKVLFPDGRLQGVGGILWREAIASQRWSGERPPASAFDRLEAVDFCGTSSLLVRASAWDAAGGLDEDIYPAYFVDVTLAMALRRAGYAVLFQPRAMIHHHQNSSTPSQSRFRHFIANRNRERFLSKWSTELEQHEPFEQESPDSMARAVARAQAAWAERAAAPPRRGIALPPFDAARQLAEHESRRNELQQSYVAHLEALAERGEIESQEKHATVKRFEIEWHEKQAIAQDRDALHLRVQALERAVAQSRETHDALLRSTSWRITAPLRALSRFIGRRKT